MSPFHLTELVIVSKGDHVLEFLGEVIMDSIAAHQSWVFLFVFLVFWCEKYLTNVILKNNFKFKTI